LERLGDVLLDHHFNLKVRDMSLLEEHNTLGF